MQQKTNLINEVNEVELDEIRESDEPGTTVLGADKYLNVVKDVEIRLSAVLGETQVTVQELFDLKTGGVLSLDKLSNEPIELVLNNQVVARGNLVVVDNNFGIQLTEVCDL